MDRGLAACEALLEKHPLLAAQYYEAAWEVGRLVLSPEFRTGPEALKRCLFLTLICLLRTHDVRNIYASCSPLLSRLYRRFGFKVVLKDACDQPDGAYSLIHGVVPEVLMALAGNEAELEVAERELSIWRVTQQKAS